MPAAETLFFGLVFHATGVPINMLVAIAGSAIAVWFSRNPVFEQIRIGYRV